MSDYQKLETIMGVLSGVKRTQDGVSIPLDDSNTDYIKYKKWLAEGNTPDSAEDPFIGDKK